LFVVQLSVKLVASNDWISASATSVPDESMIVSALLATRRLALVVVTPFALEVAIDLSVVPSVTPKA
jgi:hypothetical protein